MTQPAITDSAVDAFRRGCAPIGGTVHVSDDAIRAGLAAAMPALTAETAQRGAAEEHNRLSYKLRRHMNAGEDPCQDRGVDWPCDVAEAFMEGGGVAP